MGLVDLLMKSAFKPQQLASPHKRRRILSQLLAASALALFSILVIDTIIGQGGRGFLSMDTQQKGPIFGSTPIFLFFASFGLGYKERSKLTSILLIVGGVMIVTFWLVVPSMGWFLYFYLVLRSVYDLQIVLGCIVMGLGVLRVFQERKLGEYSRGVQNKLEE
jgi:hypothetical protein